MSVEAFFVNYTINLGSKIPCLRVLGYCLARFISFSETLSKALSSIK
jgi:hypothetical protein